MKNPRSRPKYDAVAIAAVITEIAQSRSGQFISANDVWQIIGMNAVLGHQKATMGAAFQIAKKGGVITLPRRAPIKSTHPQRKGGMIREWKAV